MPDGTDGYTTRNTSHFGGPKHKDVLVAYSALVILHKSPLYFGSGRKYGEGEVNMEVFKLQILNLTGLAEESLQRGFVDLFEA